ncbi:FMN-binding negative transcriptional regulator [Microbulbifer taiwanensis]|uniref:FMN-binding negative transcriptional regulator n=1 Tax=Microbulbifer taiwanensis TaxID=986746 RepID=UPI001D012E21|nr:FMN-binding negative transcriptional regulator [Microbulbifer taiwanensis]
MYTPKSFRNEDRKSMLRLIREYPLATLVIEGADGPEVSHVPMVLDVNGEVLRGHIARANPLARQSGSLRALAVFRGADAYISPNWYPAKAAHGKVVPTWNYVAVHVTGELRLVDEADWLMTQLQALTDQQETPSSSPWTVEDAPAQYIERLAAAIVGLELPIESLEGQWKVSQNQSGETRAAVAGGLRRRGRGADLAMAGLGAGAP